MFAVVRTHLIQPRELFGPPERQEELKECWRRNEGVFDEYTLPEGRPTFNEMFRLCKPETINVLANSDIYFERWDVGEMHRACAPDVRRFVLVLSRWDVKPDGTAIHHDHRDSQDVWVFLGQPEGIDAPFTMGNPGCDNALAWLIKQAGYAVINPSKTIRTYHLHNVPWRSYGEGRGMPKMHRISPPYELVPCTEL